MNEDCVSVTTVKVRMIDIGWLYSDEKSFLDFAKILHYADNDQIINTEFMKALLDVFWKHE